MKATDIKTIADIDAYRYEHKTDNQINSRYGTMVELYGIDTADNIMRGLEVQSWQLLPVKIR